MRACLVGPCSPQDLADLFLANDADRARSVVGYRGVPVSDLARNLVAAGHSVTVVSTDPAGGSSFQGDQISMHVIGSRRPRRYLRDMYREERARMASAIIAGKPDIVHSHWTYEFTLAAADTGLPFVTTAHDSPFAVLLNSRNLYRSARWLVAWHTRQKIQALASVSPYLAREWRRSMAYRRPIEVIPNSIPQDITADRRPTSHPTILDVADNSRLKNIRTLIRAFANVRASVPDAELRLAGPGLSDHDDLARWSRSAGLARGVAFLGPLNRSDLGQEYRSAWVMAHAAVEESCPMVLLEAHGSRLPAIGGARSGGVPYVLGEGKAGTLADVRDSRSFASAILLAIKNGPPALREDAISFIDATFSPQVVANEYVEWYERHLNASYVTGS